jgi:toxin ParE1/3/4
MRIVWTPAAADDLEQIAGYLKEHHPSYAYSTLQELYETIRSLKSFPQSGRPGREEGTRELVFARLPYIAIYRVKNNAIELLRIWHSARNRP